MLQICRKLFTDWNTENINYCHWKSNEHLMEGLDGLTDLDVYVAPADQKKAELSLAANEYIKFVPQKGARYPMVDEWIGFDYDTGKLVHVHLHYQIITGTKFNKEYIFPIDELLMKTKVLDEETQVYIASPDVEIIILYSRIVLKAKDKNNISPNKDYQVEIDYLKERINPAVLKENCTLLLGNDGNRFYDFIMKDALTKQEWYKLYEITENWLKKNRKFSKNAVKLRYYYYYFRNIRNAVFNQKLGKNYIGKKTLPGGGVSVCFLGADGSGKSTVSKDIKKWLTWKIEAKRFYLGSGDHYNGLIKRLLAKLGAKGSSGKVKSNPEEKKSENTQPQQKPTSTKMSVKRKVLHTGYAVLQSIYLKQIAVRSYKELKKAQKYISDGAVALYDRFPQNQFMGMYDGPKIAYRYFNEHKNLFVRLMAKKEEKAIEKAQKYQPNLMFKLILPPEESIRRKPDHTIEEVRPKAEITGKLKFENSKVIDIDATQNYDQELLEIKRIIWKEFVGK